ncbi:hypothetical protein TIFTF001_002940 [Ficus carica]|uniref:Fe2OG dioxygenase domain-containing protein n=1 Tax=Ficus carica TaxID=3494 RepID=A0AA88CUG6_FICCA|nr:hypothetical protein TIFTF001_002940 [Ficus carica]
MDGHEELRREVGYGGSAVVPQVLENVQVLSSKKLKEIPHHYLHYKPETDLEEVEGPVWEKDKKKFSSDTWPNSPEDSFLVPVIDMSKLLDQNPSIYHHEMARLHSACRDWGFFQLINHGVPEEVIEKMKIDTQEFFQLPLEEKKAYTQLPNDFERYGQALLFSQEQKLDWGDRFLLVVQPVSQRNMRFWPTHPNSFRENLEKYSVEMRKLTVCLLKFMSRNLGLDSDTFTSMFEEGSQAVRLNLYPPCVQANKVMGLGPHSDLNGLSLVVQVNDVQGLQIKKNGKWVPVKPVPGGFIVNIGDLIEQRLSIGAFLSPDTKTMIAPLPGLVKQSRPKYKSVSFEEYLERVAQIKRLDSKGLIDQMKLEQ